MIPGGFVAFLGVLGLPALGAPAEATPIRIELDAPPDCATAEAFYESVRARTERVRPVREGESGVRVIVRLARLGTRAHGELRVIGERGESDTRRVDGSSCTEVVEALSLTVALAVDPTARLGPPEPAAPPSPKAPPPAPPPPEAPPPLPPPLPELEVRVGAHLSGFGQVSPFVSFGGELSVRLIAPWEVASSLGLAVLRVQNDLFASNEHASVRSTLIELTGCPKRFGAGSTFTFEPCALGMLGWLGATGRGVAHPSGVTRSYAAVGGVLIGSAPFATDWDVELKAGFVLPVVRRRYEQSTPAVEVAGTPSISALGGVGVTYSF